MKKPIVCTSHVGGAFCLLLPLLILSIAGCSSPGQDPGDARVIVGLGGESGGLPKAAAPSGIASYDIVVTGDGLTDITLTYPGTFETAEIELPAGSNRNFEVTARMGAGDPGVFLAWKGSASTDLSPGETKSLTVDMALDETKIVVPDKLNYRLVQIDGINGANWATMNAGQLSYLESFEPEDVDFDASGRIFFSNPNGSTGHTAIFRVDNIDSTSFASIKWDAPARGIAVDRANNDLYYSTLTAL